MIACTHMVVFEIISHHSQTRWLWINNHKRMYLGRSLVYIVDFLFNRRYRKCNMCESRKYILHICAYWFFQWFNKHQRPWTSQAARFYLEKFWLSQNIKRLKCLPINSQSSHTTSHKIPGSISMTTEKQIKKGRTSMSPMLSKFTPCRKSVDVLPSHSFCVWDVLE